MKLFLACFSLITLATNCNSKKTALNNENTSQQTDVTISYSAHTRGFFQELILTQNSLKEFKDYEKLNAISKDLDAKEWNECIRLLSEINVATLPNLKSPTNFRQYDGAPFAQLSVIQKGDTIQSSHFDHKYPPAEIKPLVEYILSLQEN
ncbi:hypothetical protein N9X15_04590 [Flavobacteriaceae bacterium]|nr:hypothetical protein [Flavobacteriaceae bacterium]